MYQRSINFIKGSPLTTPAVSANASASPEEDYIAPADAAVRLSALPLSHNTEGCQ